MPDMVTSPGQFRPMTTEEYAARLTEARDETARLREENDQLRGRVAAMARAAARKLLADSFPEMPDDVADLLIAEADEACVTGRGAAPTLGMFDEERRDGMTRHLYAGVRYRLTRVADAYQLTEITREGGEPDGN